MTNHLFYHNYNMKQVKLSVFLTVDYAKQVSQIAYTYTVEWIINNEFLINHIQVCILFVLFFFIFFSINTTTLWIN